MPYPPCPSTYYYFFSGIRLSPSYTLIVDHAAFNISYDQSYYPDKKNYLALAQILHLSMSLADTSNNRIGTIGIFTDKIFSCYKPLPGFNCELLSNFYTLGLKTSVFLLTRFLSFAISLRYSLISSDPKAKDLQTPWMLNFSVGLVIK